MPTKRAIALLIVIMSVVAIVIGAASILILYDTAFEEKRTSLIQTARSQARLMEAVARFDMKFSGKDIPGGAIEATLSQIREAHEEFSGMGRTGEFTLARRAGNQIFFLLRLRHGSLDTPTTVRFSSNLAEPMRRALRGESGSVVGLDYRGATVLAAHEPVAVLNLGIVAKIDLAEVRAPFVRAGSYVAIVAVLLTGIGTVLFFRISFPLVRKIEENEEQQRNLLNNTSSVIYIKKPDGQYLFINRRYGELFHITNEEILGKTDYDIFPNDVADGFRTNDLKALKSNMPLELEEIVPQDDGLHTYISVKFPLKYLSGEIYAVCGISTDITERKHLEHQLRQSQRMEAVGQLTGGVAHDFNNLLGIMIGNTEMLGDQIGDDEMGQRRIGALKQAIERASSLTDRLLAFSRQQNLSPVSTSISELIVGLVEMLHRTLGETVELKVDFASDILLALVDPHQFENALINLAINARDAMPGGGVLKIQTTRVLLDEPYTSQHAGVMPGDYVKVTVSDTGSGMAPEVQGKVFEPFFTTKEFGEGSGLGLSIVYGFAKQSNGHISIASNEGEGTRVSLFLPVATGEPEERQDVQQSHSTVGGRKTILLVEDNRELRETVATMLNQFGYEVIEAKDGPTALDILEERLNEIDIVFTDVVMPNNMSGIELAEKITASYKEIKILLTSGYPDEIADQDRLKELGIELIAKPYRRAQLIAAIEDTAVH